MRTFRIPFSAMSAACEIVVVGKAEQEARHFAEIAIKEVKRIEAKYSRYTKDSIVSRINESAGVAPVPCDPETWSMLTFADSLFKSSDGLFDITSGVLRRVWDFKVAKIPDQDHLNNVLALVGWGKVDRLDQTVYLRKAGMEIDFGGFGKEYAADCAATLMSNAGLRNGYVNLAGDIRALGPKPDGTPWMIGIQDPRDRTRVMATIPLAQGGLATSGDYERFFEIDGKRYCHVLSPLTGMPPSHWRTVSVVAPLATVAGNCTTIAMLKQDQALEFLNASGMNYLAVDHRGEIFTRPQTHSAQAA